MKEISEYRTQLLDRLVNLAREFRTACLAIPNPLLPIEQDGWSVHQIAAHVRDVDQLAYGLRARRTIAEDNPEFSNFDGEAHAREHYDRNEAPDRLLDGFVQSIEALTTLLRDLPQEAWSRVSRHEKLGRNLTLQLWVERSLDHIEEHLATVKKAG